MSIASAIILIITRLRKCSVLPSISEIATVTGVADTTVRGTAAGMYPYAAEFVPTSYASKEFATLAIKKMQAHS